MLADLLLILILILANGIFAAAEIALVSARASRLKHLAEEGSSSAALVLEMRRQPERLLATVQVGVTALSALAAALGGQKVSAELSRVIRPLLEALPSATAAQSADTVSLGVVVVGISFVSLVMGELMPKSMALRFAEPLALWMARPLQILAQIGRPLVWVLTTTSNLLLKPFGDRTSFVESRVNAEELQVLIQEASRTGAVDPRSGDIAARALEFSTLTASEVCVPRNRVITIDVRATPEEVRRVFMEEGHHRMPVVDGTPDHVVGYVTAKDILTMNWQEGLIVLHDIIRPVLFIPETTRAPDILKLLQEKRQRLAIVVDEHGGMVGLVTLEDLFEELVGEFYGEGEPVPELIKRQGSGRWLVAGMTPLRDLRRVSGLRIPDDVDADTVAGLVLTVAKEIPPPGAKYQAYGATWRVTARTERRIKQVEVTTTEARRETPPPTALEDKAASP
ncbi:MAG: hemolysin family protein [Myxococcota bacterium]